METAWDALNIAWDIYAVYRDPHSWENWGALAVDVGAAIIPAVPAGAGLVVRGATRADEVLDAARGLNAAVNVAQEANQAYNVRQALERIRQVGRWVQRDESMSEAARAYQRFISGRTDDLVFEVGSYTFR